MEYPWGHQGRFNDYSTYIRRIFPGRTRKISVDAGFTCPNRDGSRGRGGCTYCNNNSFKPTYCKPLKSVEQQLLEGMEFFGHRKTPDRYLAYFQAYSNTYAPVETLEKLFGEALGVPGVAGIVIATRPDCVDEAKISLLSGLAKHHYVAVEYGIESCHDKTLERINRGHTFADAEKAIALTAGKGIYIGAHLILGLPGESRDIQLGHAEKLSRLPINTIKLHQLQIIKNTVMAKEYLGDPLQFHDYSAEAYMDLAIAFLEQLDPAIVIERFVSQVDSSLLIHPKWGLKNHEVVHKIVKRMEELDSWQGKGLKTLI